MRELVREMGGKKEEKRREEIKKKREYCGKVFDFTVEKAYLNEDVLMFYAKGKKKREGGKERGEKGGKKFRTRVCPVFPSPSSPPSPSSGKKEGKKNA